MVDMASTSVAATEQHQLHPQQLQLIAMPVYCHHHRGNKSIYTPNSTERCSLCFQTVNTGLCKNCHSSLQLHNEVLMGEEQRRSKMLHQTRGDADGRKVWFYLAHNHHIYYCGTELYFPPAFLGNE